MLPQAKTAQPLDINALRQAAGISGVGLAPLLASSPRPTVYEDFALVTLGTANESFSVLAHKTDISQSVQMPEDLDGFVAFNEAQGFQVTPDNVGDYVDMVLGHVNFNKGKSYRRVNDPDKIVGEPLQVAANWPGYAEQFAQQKDEVAARMGAGPEQRARTGLMSYPSFVTSPSDEAGTVYATTMLITENGHVALGALEPVKTPSYTPAVTPAFGDNRTMVTDAAGRDATHWDKVVTPAPVFS